MKKVIVSVIMSVAILVSFLTPANVQAMEAGQSIERGPSPNCEFHPNDVTVKTNQVVDFVIDNPEPGAVYAWNFRDNTPGKVGTHTDNVWSQPGDYIVQVTALLFDGYSQYCSTHIYVVEPGAGDIDGEALVTPVDSTNPIETNLGDSPLAAGTAEAIVGGEKKGDQNFDIGTSGDNNTTNVTINPASADSTQLPTNCSSNEVEKVPNSVIICNNEGEIQININPVPEYHPGFWEIVAEGIKDWLARH